MDKKLLVIALLASLAVNVFQFSENQETPITERERQMRSMRDSLDLFIDKDYNWHFNELLSFAIPNQTILCPGDTFKIDVGIAAAQTDDYLYADGAITAYVGDSYDTLRNELKGDILELNKNGMLFRYEEVASEIGNHSVEGYIFLPNKYDTKLPFKIEYFVTDKAEFRIAERKELTKSTN